MASPRPIAYNVLGLGDDVDKGAVEFMDDLLQLEEDLAALESEAANHTLDRTGYYSQSELGKLSENYSDLAGEVASAKNAIYSHSPYNLERYEGENHTRQTKSVIATNVKKYIEQADKLELLSDRISQRIQAKQNSANSRMIGTLTAIAVMISVLALVVSAIGVL